MVSEVSKCKWFLWYQTTIALSLHSDIYSIWVDLVIVTHCLTFLQIFSLFVQMMSAIVHRLLIVCALCCSANCNFCRDDQQFISVFNLGQDIVFQDQNKNLWKLSQTDSPRPYQPVYSLRKKSVEIDHKLMDFLAQYFGD